MAKPSGKVTIKKYANRRLYDTESSAYITLDKLAEMVREGREFEVIDAKTGDDITRSVLTQIIVEQEGGETSLLPLNFLKQIITMYGDSMQNAVPQYLESAMEAFRRNQDKAREALGGTMFAEMAKRNMAMFEDAASAFTGTVKKGQQAASDVGEKAVRKAAETAGEGLEDLRAEMARLQAKLDKLAKK